MKLNEVVFIDNLPTIDLHGFDRETAVVALNDFIRDNIKLKNNIIVVVHGIGSGIIKKAVHDNLRRNKNVVAFKIYYFNEGATIVELKF